MQTLGILEEKRLKFIPHQYWKEHEFCFFLHDRLVQLLIEYENSGIKEQVSDAFNEVIIKNNVNPDDIDILEFMKNHKLIEPYKHHIRSHVTLALTSDMLHFLYEALSCFEKRKFSVAFSLLRKPLKEHIFFLSWLLADEDDFISRFEANNHTTFNRISKEKKIEVFNKAIDKFAINETFDAELIWDMIYSKSHHNGFEPILQRATHLITSQGELLKTEDYSFNFIFEDSQDNYHYEFLYSKLPYLLMFTTHLLLESFNKVSAVNEHTFNHSLITTMGCYEALFIDGRSQTISRMLKKQLGSLLKCIHCKEPIKINKQNALDFYLKEEINCVHCGLQTEFPLYWILSMSNLLITKK